jgi:signal transduction histidine kinase/ligand-binding sensor domain-containing protein
MHVNGSIALTEWHEGDRLNRVMSRRRIIVAVAIVGVLLHTTPAAPQSQAPLTTGSTYRVAHWTTADGLPQNSILDVLVLPNDEMWLATFGGLVSFDGVRFEVIDMAVDDALPSHRIVGLEADAADAFWFLTQSGHLGRVEGGRTVSIVEPPNLAADAIGLVADGAGQLLAKLQDGTLWRTNGKAPWIAVPPPPSEFVPHLSITARNPGVAVAWKRRLLSWSSRGLVDEAALPRERMDLHNGPADQLWLSEGPSLWRFHDGRFEAQTITPPLTTAVTAVAAASSNSLWVASRGEVSRLEERADGQWRRVTVPLGLAPDMLIRQLVVDRQESLWVGTDGHGLFRVSQAPARRMGPANDVRAALGLAPDGDGGAFVARPCLELEHVDRRGATRQVDLGYRHEGRNDIGCTLALAPAGADTAYVRLGRRLLRVSRTTHDVQLVTDALTADEGPIVTTPDGSVWVTSRQGIIERVSPDGRVVQIAKVAPPVVSAALAPDGSLWVGGDGRVDHVMGSNVVTFDASAHVPRGPVRDILAEADGTVWIGTYGGGLGRLRDGRVSRLTASDGLPDNSISRILTDTRGRFWILTNRGVAVADRAELVAVADGKATRFVPVVFGPERGVPEANFGSPAGFAADDGRVWFSTIEGPVVIDATGFPAYSAPPTVRFDRVSVDDHSLPLGQEVSIPPLTGRVHLDFSSPERLYPETLRFRYRVEGVDADWVDAGSARNLSWTPRRPGRYRVLVEARNADGIWSSEPAVVVLDVQPAWWQRRTLRATAAGMFILATVAAIRWRIRRIKDRHAAQLRALELQRNADAQMSSLRHQLETVSRTALAGELAASLAHEVRQPLGAMVNNAEAGRRNLAEYLARPEDLKAILSDIVADGMRASEVITGLRGLLRTDSADAGPVNLSALAREVLPLVRREVSDARATLAVDLAADLPDVDGFRTQLGQVIVNLVLNACEALAGEHGERHVTVRTAVGADGVVLSVHDSGSGPAPAVEQKIYEPFVTTKPDGMGMGLAICRSIAESHGGRLTADRPATGGFRMTLSLPAAASDRKAR